MAIDKRSGTKVPSWASRETTPGVKIDSGPFLGIIKNNVDPARQGRLQVWIPDLGGVEEEPRNWYTVSYASPFFGSTQGRPGVDQGNLGGQQTYGFWAVPPDINNHVLVTFVMGDPSRGYWFACVPNIQTQHMTPGIARPKDNTKIEVDNFFGKSRGIPAGDVYLPANEVNLETLARDKAQDYRLLVREVATYHANTVIEQGLETDPIRGSVTSSSQRDAPSAVFGFSTPGRTVPDTATDLAGKTGGLTVEQIQQFPYRKGGHSFVMDDGDFNAENKLVRLRTSGGHQIVMHDTEEIFYISNALGTAWIELTPKGSINIFSDEDICVRSARDMNFHADRNINIHSGDTIKMYAEKNILTETRIHRMTATTSYTENAGKIGMKSESSILMQGVTGGWKCSSTLTLKGSKIYLNTMAPPDPEKNPKFEFYKQENVKYFDAPIWRWKRSPDKSFDSISPITPTHEPWTRQTGVLQQNGGGTISSSPQTPKKK